MILRKTDFLEKLNWDFSLEQASKLYVFIELVCAIAIQNIPVLICANAVLVTILGFAGRKKSGGECRASTLALGYVSCISVIYFWQNPSSHIIRYILYLISIFGNYRVIRFLRSVNTPMNDLAAIVQRVGLVQFVVCVAEVASGNNPILYIMGFESPLYISEGRVAGLMGHPIPSAFLAATCFVVGIFLFDKNKPTSALPIATNLSVLFLTQSRSAYIALAGAVLAVYSALILSSGVSRQSKRKINRLVVGAVLLGAVALLLINLLPHGSLYEHTIGRIAVLNSPQGSGSLVQRLGSIRYMSEFIASHIFDLHMWFGYGYGELADYVLENDIWFTTPGFYTIDNQYVTLLYDIGILNFTALLIFILCVFSHHLKSVVVKGPSRESLISIALMATCVISAFFFELLSWMGCLVICAGVFAYALPSLRSWNMGE